MSDDSLTCVYRSGDMASADYLAQLLQERGIPAMISEPPDNRQPRVFWRVLIIRGDANSRTEEIAALIRDFEDEMGFPHCR